MVGLLLRHDRPCNPFVDDNAMTRHFLLDTMMKAQEETLSVEDRYRKALAEAEYACWACGRFEHRDRIAEKILYQDGERTAEMICFECLETGDWLK